MMLFILSIRRKRISSSRDLKYKNPNYKLLFFNPKKQQNKNKKRNDHK